MRSTSQMKCLEGEAGLGRVLWSLLCSKVSLQADSFQLQLSFVCSWNEHVILCAPPKPPAVYWSNSSGGTKIPDYGFVNLNWRLRTVAPGNPKYAAPEAENTALQSPKIDFFHFGVLLVEMCSAQFPEVADQENLICCIQHPGMVALIQWCLAHDRKTRPTANNIVTELNKACDD